MLGSVQQMLICVYSMNGVCHLKMRLCVPNENMSSILCTERERFDGKSLLAKGVSGLAFCVLSFVCAV